MTQGFIEGATGFLQNDFVVQTANYQLLVGDKVVADHATPATRLTFTLPVTAAVGTLQLLKTGANSGGFKLAQNVGQNVKLPDGTVTATGTPGYFQSDANPCAVGLVCTVANTTWEAFFLSGRVATDAGTLYGAQVAAGANTLAQRGSVGQVAVGAPQASGDAVRLIDLGGSTLTADWAPGAKGPLTAALKGSSSNSVNVIGLARNGNTLVAVVGTATSATVAVWVSTDAGRTWAQTSANPSNILASVTTAQGVSIFVTDANTFSIAYANAVTVGAFAKTTNGGTSWTTNTNTVTSATMGVLSVVHTGIDSAFYITPVSTSSIAYFKTSNAGSTWTNGTVATETVIGFSTSVATLDATTVLAFWVDSSGGNLRWSKTTNGGTSWAAAATLAADISTNGTPAALMTTANTVVVGYGADSLTSPGAAKVLRTTDGGSNWSTVFDATARGVSLQATNVYQAISWGYDGTTLIAFFITVSVADDTSVWNVIASTDEGATFTHTRGTGLGSSTTQNSRVLVIGSRFYVGFGLGTSTMYLFDIRKAVMLT